MKNLFKKMQNEANTDLEKNCMIILSENIDRDNIESVLQDLSEYWCVSWMISGLTYYSDTVNFFNDNKDEINTLLSEFLSSTGLSIKEAFKKDYCEEDPLFLDDSNRNLMAWFAFEDAIKTLAEKAWLVL